MNNKSTFLYSEDDGTDVNPNGIKRLYSNNYLIRYANEFKKELPKYKFKGDPVNCIAVSNFNGWITLVTPNNRIVQCWASDLILA